MKTIFEKWWDRGDKCFSIRNYKRAWKAVGNKPILDYHTNGAVKGRDSCLDVTLTIGYIVFNYTDFDYRRSKR